MVRLLRTVIFHQFSCIAYRCRKSSFRISRNKFGEVHIYGASCTPPTAPIQWWSRASSQKVEGVVGCSSSWDERWWCWCEFFCTWFIRYLHIYCIESQLFFKCIWVRFFSSWIFNATEVVKAKFCNVRFNSVSWISRQCSCIITKWNEKHWSMFCAFRFRHRSCCSGCIADWWRIGFDMFYCTEY